MNELFKRTAEYRHWIACHDLAALAPSMEKEMRATVKDVLPEVEQSHWEAVCYKYDKNDLPSWFRKMVDEF